MRFSCRFQEVEYKGPQSTIGQRHVPNPRDVKVWKYVVASTAKASLATLWFHRTSTGLSSTETTIVKLVALRVARGQAPLFEWHREDRRKAAIAEGQRVCLYKLNRHAGAARPYV